VLLDSEIWVPKFWGGVAKNLRLLCDTQTLIIAAIAKEFPDFIECKGSPTCQQNFAIGPILNWLKPWSIDSSGMYNPEESKLHSRRRENLKSHLAETIFSVTTHFLKSFTSLSFKVFKINFVWIPCLSQAYYMSYLTQPSSSSSFPFPFVPLQRRGCLVAPLFLWIVLVPCAGD
jgi:hypothetical protein